MNFSENLKRIRKKSGYTQQEIAERLSVAQATVANYERGVRIPDIDTLIELSKIFGVSMDELIGVHTQPERKPSDSSRWERAMEQYADMSPDERRRIDAVLDAFFPDDTKPSGIIHETTVGAEQDRRAATDDEAEETAV